MQRSASVAQQAELEPSAAKLQQHVSYLASDALDGRRTGTAGANDAARYIAGEFSRLGLRPGNETAAARRRREVMAQYLQTFPYIAGVNLGPQNVFTFGRSSTNEGSLVVGNDWVPLAYSANGKVSGGIVFAGFGITASELNYDDYAGLNATGKIAIALQGTPDGDNPHGQFARLQDARWKTIAARNAGAKALIVVARDGAFIDDRLTNLTYDNTAGEAGLPVIVMSRQSLDKILALSNTTISDLEKASTAKTAGTNRTLNGEMSLSTDLIRKEVPAYNVVGRARRF